METSVIYGCEAPRIFTPPLRDLTPETTLGFEVIDFSEEVLHVELLPWQKWLVIHALEIIDDPVDGWRLRFRTVVVEVARQNGKTTLSKVISLYFMYQLDGPGKRVVIPGDQTRLVHEWLQAPAAGGRPRLQSQGIQS